MIGPLLSSPLRLVNDNVFTVALMVCVCVCVCALSLRNVIHYNWALMFETLNAYRPHKNTLMELIFNNRKPVVQLKE